MGVINVINAHMHVDLGLNVCILPGHGKFDHSLFELQVDCTSTVFPEHCSVIVQVPFK